MVGIKEAILGLELFPNVFLPEIDKELSKPSSQFVKKARENVPVMTGNLQRNIYENKRTIRNNKIYVSFIANTPYAQKINDGEINGEPIITTVGRSGGGIHAERYSVVGEYPYKDFFGKAGEETEGDFKKAIIKGAERAIKKVFG